MRKIFFGAAVIGMLAAALVAFANGLSGTMSAGTTILGLMGLGTISIVALVLTAVWPNPGSHCKGQPRIES
jgi:uncharacterized membrane protein